MTTFKYTGLSPSGAELNGVIRATDEFDAVSRLRETCSVITKIEEVKDTQTEKKRSSRFKITEKEISIMCSQFAIILRAGIPVVRCVEMVADQSGTEELRGRLLEVAEDIDGGMTMAQSFAAHLPGLPATFIETIKAGEKSGTLEMCFGRLHSYYDKTSKTKGKMSSAFTYPIIVVVVAIAAFFVIMLKAVPMFKKTFEEIGVELPGITKALIGFSDFMVSFWWLILLILAGLVFAFLSYKRTENGSMKIAEWMLLKMPFHNIVRMNASALFASTLSTMVASGMTILDGLEVTAGVAGNKLFGKEVLEVKEEVERGSTIVDAMRRKRSFPKLLTEMTGVGEDSGAMEATLDVVADYFDNEVSLATDKLLAAMEPAITILLAVVVVILLLAVYLPMFSLYSSF